MERITDLLRRGEAMLDGWGRPGWIGAMVLGFILAWPVGLALLFYMIWSGRMGRECRQDRRWSRSRRGGTGNAAFDDYKEATLRRLEEEQAAFESFLERLRRAKDQAEFDQFMDERRRGGPTTRNGDDAAAEAEPRAPYAGPGAPQPA
ncbi:MAG TPA: DUF2852 domain-containing protein [Paracoccaceae bacterium]|nr:DUF2852 domain-containing protein [Paracoccaceae bacterium]